MRIAVLVSGSGTILDAIFEAGVPLACVVSDRPCRGLELAGKRGVEAVLVDRADFGGFSSSFDREAYTERLTEELRSRSIELVAMAGFGTVLAASIHEAFAGRIMNTHPALLPAFPGWHGVEDALDAGVEVTGCTVHLATLEMDAGPILVQREVAIEPGDTVESLHERIKAVERLLYPTAIAEAAHALEQGESIEIHFTKQKEATP
jgi:phosphoribosylglycinamide formyltransferase-1